MEMSHAFHGRSQSFDLERKGVRVTNACPDNGYA